MAVPSGGVGRCLGARSLHHAKLLALGAMSPALDWAPPALLSPGPGATQHVAGGMDGGSLNFAPGGVGMERAVLGKVPMLLLPTVPSVSSLNPFWGDALVAEIKLEGHSASGMGATRGSWGIGPWGANDLLAPPPSSSGVTCIPGAAPSIAAMPRLAPWSRAAGISLWGQDSRACC